MIALVGLIVQEAAQLLVTPVTRDAVLASMWAPAVSWVEVMVRFQPGVIPVPVSVAVRARV